MKISEDIIFNIDDNNMYISIFDKDLIINIDYIINIYLRNFLVKIDNSYFGDNFSIINNVLCKFNIEIRYNKNINVWNKNALENSKGYFFIQNLELDINCKNNSKENLHLFLNKLNYYSVIFDDENEIFRINMLSNDTKFEKLSENTINKYLEFSYSKNKDKTIIELLKDFGFYNLFYKYSLIKNDFIISKINKIFDGSEYILNINTPYISINLKENKKFELIDKFYRRNIKSIKNSNKFFNKNYDNFFLFLHELTGKVPKYLIDGYTEYDKKVSLSILNNNGIKYDENNVYEKLNNNFYKKYNKYFEDL